MTYSRWRAELKLIGAQTSFESYPNGKMNLLRIVFSLTLVYFMRNCPRGGRDRLPYKQTGVPVGNLENYPQGGTKILLCGCGFKLFSPLKSRPNDCNMSTEHIATLLARLSTLLRSVLTCWELKLIKFFMHHLWMILWSIGQVRS